ncbi:DNA repair and recombination protein RadB [Candidatus Burarchaeum australiense]|nr:DNA repair and recombination protein RadB [Candidatus Burarchaeum australiense]
MERVSTGLKGLDEILGGGYPRGGIISVAGGTGTGKSTFALQFLYEGVTVAKENGLYITFEEERGKVYEFMSAYGWNFEQLEKDKRFLFFSYPPHEVDHFLAQELMIHDKIEEFHVKRVVLDTVTSFAVLYETELKKRQEIVKLLTKLKNWGCTVMLTADCNTDAAGTPLPQFDIEPLSDGVIYLYSIRKGEQRLRALEVAKMRGTKFSERLFLMRFAAKGMEIYPNEHVY